jgi:molybdopterin molybdotransferase
VRTVEEHRAAVLAAVTGLGPGLPVEIALDRAHGLVLGADVRSRTDVPPFDNSAMDGYAVRVNDVRGATRSAPIELKVIADIPAGSRAEPLILPGTCARIMTGAPVPRSAEAVVPVEGTDGGTDLVAVHVPAERGAHIRRKAEDVLTYARVMRSGRVLGPADIAAAAATGHGGVMAYPAPKVVVISTGSELVPPGPARPVPRGMIPDSNSYLLSAAVAEAGGDPVRFDVVTDDSEKFGLALDAALADLSVVAIVTSGGISVGAYDVVKEHLTGRFGWVTEPPDAAPARSNDPTDPSFDWDAVVPPRSAGGTFASVAMQPGKPQGFGLVPRGGRQESLVPLFTLPGNPVSVFVSFEVFVRPALQILRGLSVSAGERLVVAARATASWRSAGPRRQYIPVQATFGATGWTARPAGVRGSSSHLAATLASANGLGIVEAGVGMVRAGDTVPVMLTRGPLG